jgi:hypothetical protein
MLVAGGWRLVAGGWQPVPSMQLFGPAGLQGHMARTIPVAGEAFHCCARLLRIGCRLIKQARCGAQGRTTVLYKAGGHCPLCHSSVERVIGEFMRQQRGNIHMDTATHRQWPLLHVLMRSAGPTEYTTPRTRIHGKIL